MDILSSPRSVVLKNDMDWEIADLKFESCNDAIFFLWDKVRNGSVKWKTVNSAFHTAWDRNRKLYGYIIVKDPDYVPEYY